MAARLRSEQPQLRSAAAQPVKAAGSGQYSGIDARQPGFNRRQPRITHEENIDGTMMGDHPLRDVDYVATSRSIHARVKLARWYDDAAKK